MNENYIFNTNTEWSKGTIFNRPGAKNGCTICGHKFKKGELFAIGETRQSWFRGDDLVAFLCKDCTPKKIIKKLKLK